MMTSPNFSINDAPNGFTAVNERPISPVTGVDAGKNSSPSSHKRRIDDVEPGSDDPPRNGTANGTAPSNHEIDPRFTQSGAARDPNWQQVDDARMAQLLQADDSHATASKPDGPPETPNGTELMTTKAGLQYDQKKRKRAFTNRTKTGCITCRKRKKKCDEGKPHCNNCLRGGFPCGGYTQRRDLTDPKTSALQAKYAPVPIQSRDYWDNQTSRPSRPYDPSPIHGISDGRHILDDGLVSHGPISSWSNPMNGGPRPPLGSDRSLPPLQSSYSSVPRNGDFGNMYGNKGVYAPMALVRTAERALLDSEKHNSAPPSNPMLENPQNNLDQMMSGHWFKPDEAPLVALRKRAETACEVFNSISSKGAGPEDSLKFLRNIIEIDPSKPEVSVNHSTPSLYVGSNVTIYAPFNAVYGFNLRLCDNVVIKGACRFEDCREIRINQDTTIGHGVIFNTELHLNDRGYKSWRRGVKIWVGRNVYIGDRAVIAASDTTPTARDAQEIHIGDEVYIGPGAVITSSVPPKTTIGAGQSWNGIDTRAPHQGLSLR